MANAHMKEKMSGYNPAGEFTPEQIEQWKRGELCIEFQFDELPQVNQQDFEKWVRERGIKPNLIQYSDHNCSFDVDGIPTWEVPPLSPETGHCIK